MTDKTTTDKPIPQSVITQLLDAQDVLNVAKNYVELIFIAHDRPTAADSNPVAAVANGAVIMLETVQKRLDDVIKGAA